MLADLCREKAKVFSIIGDHEPVDGFKQPEAKERPHNLRWPSITTKQRPSRSITVEFVAATSPTQEVISLKKWLTQWINSDPTNSLRDVQIVTPDPGLYGPIVQRIFHASEQDQRLPTSPDPLLSRPLESVAIDLFAQSYATGFKAGSLYALSHPTIRARRPQTESDPHLRQIEKWLVRSGARRGLSGHTTHPARGQEKAPTGSLGRPRCAPVGRKHDHRGPRANFFHRPINRMPQRPKS